jgi:rhodanese-related sulfurtransferase
MTNGEVPPVAFIKAQNKSADAIILDVRTSDETSVGKLKSAKLVPLNDLYDRFEELPKNRKIYIYCATGARAQMAARLLRDNGYDAYFLVADILCAGGKCRMVF